MAQLGSPPIKFGMYQAKVSKSLNEKGDAYDPEETEERIFNVCRFNNLPQAFLKYNSNPKGTTSKKIIEHPKMERYIVIEI